MSCTHNIAVTASCFMKTSNLKFAFPPKKAKVLKDGQFLKSVFQSDRQSEAVFLLKCQTKCNCRII